MAPPRKLDLPFVDCKQCGKTFRALKWKREGKEDYVQQYCSGACRNYARQPEGPKGYIHHSGYRYFNVAGGKRGTAIAEHKMVMERMLGRPLRKDETVHHRNGIRTDNRPENLELWSGRHGKGHRVADQVEFAKETLKIYGEGPFDVSFIERGKADLMAALPHLGMPLSH